jgi:large subunit ribosomal protein L31
MQEIKTELCSACHPFYTGKQKLVDTARRIEKYQAKVAVKKDAAKIVKKKVKRAVKQAKKAAKASEK